MSKLVEQKMRERNDRLHRKRINNMKPGIDNKPPKEHLHLINNAKKAQLEEDRLTEVERQNGILLGKLSEIAQRPEQHKLGPSSSKALVKGQAPGEARVGTLNANYRKQEMMKIAEENQQLLKRIQAKQSGKSEYSRDKFDKDFQAHQEFSKLSQQNYM